LADMSIFLTTIMHASASDAFGKRTLSAPLKLDTRWMECEVSSVTVPDASIYSVSKRCSVVVISVTRVFCRRFLNGYPALYAVYSPPDKSQIAAPSDMESRLIIAVSTDPASSVMLGTPFQLSQ